MTRHRSAHGSIELPPAWRALDGDDAVFVGPAEGPGAPMLAGKGKLVAGRASVSLATVALEGDEKLSDAVARQHALLLLEGDDIKLVDVPAWTHPSVANAKLVAVVVTLKGGGQKARQAAAFLPRGERTYLGAFFSVLDPQWRTLEPVFQDAFRSLALPE